MLTQNNKYNYIGVIHGTKMQLKQIKIIHRSKSLRANLQMTFVILTRLRLAK